MAVAKLPYEDLYRENIKGVYVNMVEIKYGTENEHSTIYLNDSGTAVTFAGNVYLPVAFSLTEPDKTSPEEGSGTLSIAGVPSDYIAIIQNFEYKKDSIFALEAFMVKIVLDESGVVEVEGDGDGETDGYILARTEYDISNISMKSADASISLSLKTGGALGYIASKYRYTSTNFPGLCG